MTIVSKMLDARSSIKVDKTQLSHAGVGIKNQVQSQKRPFENNHGLLKRIVVIPNEGKKNK